MTLTAAVAVKTAITCVQPRMKPLMVFHSTFLDPTFHERIRKCSDPSKYWTRSAALLRLELSLFEGEDFREREIISRVDIPR